MTRFALRLTFGLVYNKKYRFIYTINKAKLIAIWERDHKKNYTNKNTVILYGTKDFLRDYAPINSS